MARAKRERWDAKKVISVIKDFSAKKQPLNVKAIYESRRSLLTAAYKYFGGWSEAISAAGLDYGNICLFCTTWSQTTIRDTIKKLHADSQPLNSNHAQLNNRKLYGAAVTHFGGWREAIEAAGLKYEMVRIQDQKKWNKKKIVRAIRLRKRRRLSLNGGVVEGENRGLYSAARHHFGRGGWRKALKKAGVNPNALKDPRVIWDAKAIVKKIQKFHRKNLPLNARYLATNGYGGLLAAGERVFGAWGKAIKAAGFDYDSVRLTKKWNYWNEKRILAEIRRLARAGARLNSKDTQRLPGHGGFFNAACEKFGSWGAAVEAAGFDYRLHCKTWSYKAWLRRLDNGQFQAIERRVKVLAKKGKRGEKPKRVTSRG